MQVKRLNFQTSDLTKKKKKRAKFNDFNSKKHEYYWLPGCDTLQSGRYLPVFQRNDGKHPSIHTTY